MYFPYIRAKQYDLAAILELNHDICSSERVIPIIEPVASIKVAQYKKLIDKDIPFILVVNPNVGPLKSTTPNSDIIDLLVNDVFSEHGNYYLGFIIQPTTTLREIQNFISTYSGYSHAFIHFYEFHDTVALERVLNSDDDLAYNIYIENRVSLEYINSLNDTAPLDVIIKDGFIKRTRNADYPDLEYFSNLHRIYETELGYNGFGDFTVIGSEFGAGGGPAYVVAIHLTDVDNKENLIVRHFKSSTLPPLTTTDPGGKFREALRKLKRHLDVATHLNSDGVRDYRIIHRDGNFPGLGIPKKISIKHHIELVYDLM